MNQDIFGIGKIKKIASDAYVDGVKTEAEMLAKANVIIDPRKILPGHFVSQHKERLNQGIEGAMSLYIHMLRTAANTFKSAGIYLDNPYEHMAMLSEMATQMFNDYMKRRSNERGQGKN